MPKLGVNIDHIATLREARKGYEPDPVMAALVCEKAGCDSIVCHLREDRRHINDNDLKRLRMVVKTKLNLEMSVAKEIVDIACKVGPDQVTLVPERRQEITTEGGLDVVKFEKRVAQVVAKLQDKGIEVSLFIDPVKRQIDASYRTGARIIEFHTGEYANAKTKSAACRQFEILKSMTEYALGLGFEVNAGHGLNYTNTRPVAKIKGMHELNIGHSIISRAIFTGLAKAVKEMVEIAR
jgi:pyridoxine 5-phosphate synthase